VVAVARIWVSSWVWSRGGRMSGPSERTTTRYLRSPPCTRGSSIQPCGNQAPTATPGRCSGTSGRSEPGHSQTLLRETPHWRSDCHGGRTPAKPSRSPGGLHQDQGEEQNTRIGVCRRTQGPFSFSTLAADGLYTRRRLNHKPCRRGDPHPRRPGPPREYLPDLPGPSSEREMERRTGIPSAPRLRARWAPRDVEQFEDAWKRYLPDTPPLDPQHRHNVGMARVSAVFGPQHPTTVVADPISSKAKQDAGCGGVADREGVDTDDAWDQGVL